MAERNFSKGIEMQNLYLRLKNRLEDAGIIPASFELRQLLYKLTGNSSYDIRLENEFSDEQIIELENMVDRRIEGEPLQYILGEWEFMGLPMKVQQGVLIPRAETELLCEHGFDFLEHRDSSQRRILDLCCGTGCIGIAASKYIENAEVTCVDLYDTPLDITRRNAELNGVNINIVRADALADPPFNPGSFDLILTNPPYIPTMEMASLQKEVTFEPNTALDGGDDGLMFYRAGIQKWSACLVHGGAYMAEVGIGESEHVGDILAANGYVNISVNLDYASIPRVVIGIKQ